MKKIRLFAIASAMGMFASTVSAAEYVTKDAYVATWGKVDEIIKVDIGDKVVLPTAEINVVKETRTTDPKYGSYSDSLGLDASEKCYAGFTNEEGKDSNGDGYVDAKILTAGINNLTSQGWLHTDAKFFPTAKTALYYIGLGNGSITGGRFLAPGAAENKGTYTLALKHKNFENEEAVIKFLEDNKFVNFEYDEDSYIKYVDLKPTTITDDAKGKNVRANVSLRLVSLEGRHSDEEITNAVLAYALKGTMPADSANEYVVKYAVSETYQDGEDIPYSYNAFETDGKTPIPGTLIDNILIVEENRYGDLIADEIVATAGDIKGTEGKITVVVKGGTDAKPTYTKYATVTPKTHDNYAAKAKYVWDDETGTFSKIADKAIELTSDEFADYNWGDRYVNGVKTNINKDTFIGQAHAFGLYKVTSPANTSDKIVINTDGLDLNITGINIKKETISIGYGSSSELTTAAVKLGNKWYPAVTNEADLARFAEKVLGLTTLNNDDFAKWVKNYEKEIDNPFSGVTKAERTNVKGDKESYVPENSLQHYKGTFCTYKLASGESVPATITGNTDAVDTSTSGVKTLTLTAKVGDVVVGTKDVKVVVAPKYERVYKNGRVITLKAFHLNGALYAVYNYDWAGKKYTATFYAQDGITVASTANGTL